MSTFRLAPVAQRDLEDIWDYISADNPAAADRMIDLFVEKIQLLAREPDIGRLRPEVRPDIRSFPVRKYVIFYRTASGHLEIVRVLSGYRDIETSFEES